MKNQEDHIQFKSHDKPSGDGPQKRALNAVLIFISVFLLVMAAGILLVSNHKKASRESPSLSVSDTEQSRETTAVPETTVSESTETVPAVLTLSDKVLYHFEGEEYWAQFLESEAYRQDHYSGEFLMEGWNLNALYYTISDFDGDGNSALILMSREKDKPMCRIWIWEKEDGQEPILALEEVCGQYIYYNPNFDALVLFKESEEWTAHYSLYSMTDGTYQPTLDIEKTTTPTGELPVCHVTENGQRKRITWEEYQKSFANFSPIPDWIPLLPDPVIPDRQAEDLSYLLGEPIGQFKARFSNLTALGSYPVSLTNYEVMATPDDDNHIVDISISSVGAPYSILGIQCGMSAETAASFAEAYGAIPEDDQSSKAVTYTLPEENVRLCIFYADGPEGPIVKEVMLARNPC